MKWRCSHSGFEEKSTSFPIDTGRALPHMQEHDGLTWNPPLKFVSVVVFLSYSRVYLSIRNSALIDLVRFQRIRSVSFSFLRRVVEITPVFLFVPGCFCFVQPVFHTFATSFTLKAAGAFDLFWRYVCCWCWWLSKKRWILPPAVVAVGKLFSKLFSQFISIRRLRISIGSIFSNFAKTRQQSWFFIWNERDR